MNTNKTILLILLGLILLVGGCGGCSAISFQKQAVQEQENVKSAWGKVQSQYQRRADLIDNLVRTVKGSANFEQETLTKVVEARAKATSVQVDPTNLTPEKLAEFQKAQGELSGALSRLLVTVEKYPDLKASQAFLELQAQIEGTENRIAVARNDFNDTVQGYNTLIRKFPNNFFAGWMGFTPKGYFEAQPGSDVAPKVEF